MQGFSPRKWIKHCYLQGFVHVTIFDFLKMCKYQHFLRSSRQKKIVSKSAESAVIYRGLGAVTGKSCQKHNYLQGFVPSTFSWHCKNFVNTSIFCNQHAKNVVIYRVFFASPSKTLVFAVLRLKSIGIYNVFCVFALFPQKTSKRTNAVIYKNLFLKAQNRPKNVSKWRFFSVLGTSKREGGAGECSWRRLWATRIPSKKLSPTQLKDFDVLRGPGAEWVRGGSGKEKIY